MDYFCEQSFSWLDPSYSSRNSSGAVPSVSECVQLTVAVWLPALFFWTMLPLFLMQIWRYEKRKRFRQLPCTILMLAKFFVTILLFVDALLLFLKYFDDGDEYSVSAAVYLTYPLIRALTMVGMFFCMKLARDRGIVSSGILHNTWVLHMVCALPELYSYYLKAMGYYESSYPSSTFRLLAFLTWFLGVTAQSLLFCFADKRTEEEIFKSKNSPELDSSFLSRLVLWWFNELPVRGAKQDLVVDDLFELNHGSSSEHLVPLWEHYWIPTIEKYNEKKRSFLAEGTTNTLLTSSTKVNGHTKEHDNKTRTEKKELRLKPPSIVYNLFKMFKWELLFAGSVKMGADVLQFVNPYLLKKLIDFVSDENAHLWQGVFYALVMFLASELRSFMVNQYFYVMFRMGIKIQTSLTSAVYKKTLRLSNVSRRERTTGEIVNLMAIDVERFQMLAHQIQQYWSSPFQVSLALIFLFNTLGVSALPGVFIMAIFVPLSVFSSIFTRSWQVQQMKLKDERTKMINEILNGIKVIKLYAWEVPMIETIENIRKKELSCILKAGLVKSVVDTFNFWSPFLVAICSFTTYSSWIPTIC
uniref:ABC transmembrane type-1 domain-containing protein n=1 Tax=Ditylenchus dipsaci TaxID=166011 RepID=A0A915EUJ8_9BILA